VYALFCILLLYPDSSFGVCALGTIVAAKTKIHGGVVVQLANTSSQAFQPVHKEKTMLLNLIIWIILGGIAGWIASIIMGRNAQMGIGANIVVGIIGALIGGFIMNTFGQAGVTGFNFYSLIVAVIGAVVLLFILGLVRRTA
jgi:uncharacterized membrane protein YeaQ/YmgE (transglycosylase-associated protein family)